MRQTISDTATRLFMARGFDHVTVDEIAEAADVGRMTVFNHFPRKEDLFFDLDEAIRDVLRDALRRRGSDISPVETLRLLAHSLIAEESRYLRFFPGSQLFVETVQGSSTLMNRAREIRDELAQDMASALALSAGREGGEIDAQLASALLLATWSTAFVRAHGCYRRTGDAAQAKAVFLSIIDRGTAGLTAALRGTPYV
jgi:AcrR family transcriptional regulator